MAVVVEHAEFFLLLDIGVSTVESWSSSRRSDEVWSADAEGCRMTLSRMLLMMRVRFIVVVVWW